MRRDTTYLVPLLATLLLHAGLGAGLHVAGLLVDRRARAEAPIEIEIVEPPPPRIQPPPPPPLPEPEPEPEPKVDEPKPRPVPRQQPAPRKLEAKAPPPSDEPPPDEPPAPGPVTSHDAPAPVVRLPGIAPGGTGPPVAVGRPTSRKVGTGGTGTNTGGGGGAPGGTGAAPPPVSIASIKVAAKPLNPDLDAGKLYPPEARRLGIEGEIKVRLVVDEQGKVAQRRLLTRLGYGLDELAMDLAQRLRFEPARDTRDQPVRSVVVWKFSFVLPE